MGSQFPMNGVTVSFPYDKAYPSQMAMISKIIGSLQTKQNALLESPTGSGKSLALLCGSLSWLRHEKARVAREGVAAAALAAQQAAANGAAVVLEGDLATLAFSNHLQDYANSNAPAPAPQETGAAAVAPAAPVKQEKTAGVPVKPEPVAANVKAEPQHGMLEGDDDFKPTPVRSSVPSSSPVPSLPPPVASPSSSSGLRPASLEEKDRSNRVPRIYYGTRTHKQIAQVVREFKRAGISARMAILGSREHYCIHETVSRSSSKNEDCRVAVEKQSCRYHRNAKQVPFEKAIAGQVWDIEDLVKAGRRKQGCPFYASRDLAKSADIIFCPYNYILDPAIRDSMEIDLDGDVVIVDEAHNIEDVARDAASISVTDVVLLDIADNFERVLNAKDVPLPANIKGEHQLLFHFTKKLISWVERSAEHATPYGFDKANYVWHGKQIMGMFEEAGITSSNYGSLTTALTSVIDYIRGPDDDSEQDEKQQKMKQLEQASLPKMPLSCLTTIQGLIRICGYLLDPAYPNTCDDYRMVMMKEGRKDTFRGPTSKAKGGYNKRKNDNKNGRWSNSNMAQSSSSTQMDEDDDGWVSFEGGNGGSPVTQRQLPDFIHTLSLWCFNPAVTFRTTSSKARCIILTSGTLAPLDTFASELGVNFPVRLEANHVIPKSSVWVGCIGYGPDNSPLDATYRNAQTFDFQDQVGKVVLDVAQRVPHGVLCFFSSYSMLERMTQRWDATGLAARLRAHKAIVCEPRASDKSQFEDSMQTFYSAIQRSTGKGAPEGDEEKQQQQQQQQQRRRNPFAPKSTNNIAEMMLQSTQTGAIFFAVCRGKVSEGLDFADENARAVITVGIPFPSFKDIQVELKRKYNDSHAQSRNLLTGAQWYEIQAYRALNQALGRCIRHVNDWGAIVLIDERFTKERSTKSLSKWVRNQVQTFPQYDQALGSLTSFMDLHLQKAATSSSAAVAALAPAAPAITLQYEQPPPPADVDPVQQRVLPPWMQPSGKPPLPPTARYQQQQPQPQRAQQQQSHDAQDQPQIWHQPEFSDGSIAIQTPSSSSSPTRRPAATEAPPPPQQLVTLSCLQCNEQVAMFKAGEVKEDDAVTASSGWVSSQLGERIYVATGSSDVPLSLLSMLHTSFVPLDMNDGANPAAFLTESPEPLLFVPLASCATCANRTSTPRSTSALAALSAIPCATVPWYSCVARLFWSADLVNVAIQPAQQKQQQAQEPQPKRSRHE